MKARKDDHRSRYTQMVVKDALLKLLAEKQPNKITVSELCRSAGINRGTFYSHFYDVFDAYECIENDFFAEVGAKLENIKSDDIDRPFFREIMLLIYKHSDLVRLIISEKASSDILKRIIGFVRAKFIAEWSESFKGHTVVFLNRVFTYITNGSIGMISDWITDGMREPLDDVSEAIAELNDLIINEYLSRDRGAGGRRA